MAQGLVTHQIYIGPPPAPRVPEIDRLLDDGRYQQAARLALQARDTATVETWRRRYHGLYLFASSRLPEGAVVHALPPAPARPGGHHR